MLCLSCVMLHALLTHILTLHFYCFIFCISHPILDYYMLRFLHNLLKVPRAAVLTVRSTRSLSKSSNNDCIYLADIILQLILKHFANL